MYLESYIVVSLFGSLFFLSFAVAFLYFMHARGRKIEADHAKMYQETAHVIEEAQTKAKKIIERAVDQAHQMLAQTEYLKHDIVVTMEKNLNEVSDATVHMLREEALTFKNEYKQVLTTMKDEHAHILDSAKGALEEVEILKKELLDNLRVKSQGLSEETVKRLDEETANISHEFKQTLEGFIEEYKAKSSEIVKQLQAIPEQELSGFREILRAETVASQKILSERINQAFDDAQKEIEEYKKTQITKIESNVQAVAQKVIEQVLGDSFTLDDHAKLIQRALEQARKDKIFETISFKV